jgi:hypothetical protein
MELMTSVMPERSNRGTGTLEDLREALRFLRARNRIASSRRDEQIHLFEIKAGRRSERHHGSEKDG